MIASGLCVMGGCFALENGAAVDTYWPASRAVFSPELDAESLKVISFLNYGGDSVYDRALLSGSFTSDYNFVSWKIAVGMNRPENIQQGRINVICDAQTSIAVYADYGNRRIELANKDTAPTGVEVMMQVADGRAHIGSTLVCGSLADSYSLDDSVSREFLVRSKITKVFSIFWYSNARLGARWCVRAMQSPAGASALYADADESLTEI